MAQIVQQPDQRQLRIWLRIDPQLDRLASLAEVDQSEVFSCYFSEMPRADKIQPVGARRAVLRRARLQERCELRIGRQRSPGEPKAEPNHDVGEAGPLEASGPRVVRRQDQTRHVYVSEQSRLHPLTGTSRMDKYRVPDAV